MSLRAWNWPWRACYHVRARALSTCKGSRAVSALKLCRICGPQSVAVSLHGTGTETRPVLVGRVSFGVCVCVGVGWWVWFLLSEQEHGKRGGLSAVYPYICGVGLYPAGRWACDIVEVGAVCGLGAGLTVVDGGRVFLLHVSGGLEGYKDRAGGRFNPQPLGGLPCYGKMKTVVRYDPITVSVFLGHLSPTKVVRAGLVGAWGLVSLEQGATCGAVVSLQIRAAFLGGGFNCLHVV